MCLDDNSFPKLRTFVCHTQFVGVAVVSHEMATVLASVVELDDDIALLSRLEDIHLSPKTKVKCILKLSLCTNNDKDID